MFPLIPRSVTGPPSYGAAILDVAYSNMNDRTKHMDVIARLADELHRPQAEIKPLYESILTDLRAKARICDYLPILVSKRIKKFLKDQVRMVLPDQGNMA